jgi:hypothetical protein
VAVADGVKRSEGGNIMAKIDIGKVKNRSGYEYRVYWDETTQEIYIEYRGVIGRAQTAREAIQKADAYMAIRD